jgi:signal transduction histidine kinase
VSSIRIKLVLWLLGGLTCGIMLALWATYGAVRAQIGAAFDGELKQVAHAVLIREDWIESGRVRIARPGFSFAVRAYDRRGRMYFETALPAVPREVPQLYQQGYHRMETSDGMWRLYTYVAPEGIVQVGQPVALRDALARDLSLRVIVPLLLLIPVLAVVVIWGLGRGLAPLGKTTERVAQRDATLLDPLPIADVPRELLPLVEQINGLMARLSRSLDAQRDFLADVAHELRSPMAALTLQAQLAERAATPAARQAAFAELKRGLDRAIRLVQQLLDFARLESGMTGEPAERVDIARLAREEVGAQAVRADTLRVDLGADTPAAALVVMGREYELRSMICNLIDNALRYTPRDGSVTVSVLRADDKVVLDVSDAGPGIPAAQRERVFRRFQRVPGDHTPGTGLGLSIVKAIIERHQGTLVLEDANPGSERPGLRVHITLPLLATEPVSRTGGTPMPRAA